MSVAHALEAGALDAAFGAFGRMSWPGALRAGATLGTALGKFGLRKKVARANLALAFPERSDAERESILARHYEELGRIAAEYGRLGRLVRAAEGEVMAEVEGLDAWRALAGRGALLLSGHLGNFEFGAAWLTRVNPVDFLVQPLSNRAVDARVRRLREDAGVGVISTHGGVKEVFRALKRGRWVCIAADQDAGRRGVFVPFFGRLASTAEGAARIALQTGVPLAVATIARGADGRHTMVCEPPRTPEGASDEANVTALTAWHTSILERGIRRAPEQYFWLHRRWKTRPLGER